ncbi:MAG: hypothetical protein L3J63_03900 [Geopsychrobacter sp.]|nr:hypothetical protein [Geopsychrobacter sp.]
MVDKILPTKSVLMAKEQSRDLYRKLKKDAEEQLSQNEDRVSLTKDREVATYGRLAGVEVGSPYQLLQQLVIKTLNDQGVSSLVSTGEGEINLGTLTPDAAQELVSEDGYFGVDKTSQRIVDFAINAFGNDPAKLTQMKDAIEKGFKQAAGAFNGQLPDISHQTYAAVMDKLDAFARAGEKEGEDHG